MKTTLFAVFAVIAAVVMVPSIASAQKPVNVGDAVSATFSIVAIDSGNRIVTLEGKDGITEDVYCGPEVQRFDQLKVGDKVTFRYYESLVSAISRPGAAPAPSAAGVARSASGATISQQKTVTVTINAIDPKVPSVTVTGPKGNKMSFKVDKKNIEGYKAGDKVDITYTQALAISVTK